MIAPRQLQQEYEYFQSNNDRNAVVGSGSCELKNLLTYWKVLAGRA